MEKRRNQITIRQVINIILIILLLTFTLQNFESVTVKFLFFGFQLPLVILIVIVFFIGFLIAKNLKIFKRKKQDNE